MNGSSNRWTRRVAAGALALMLLGSACAGEPVSTLESAVAAPLVGTACEELAFEVGDQVDAKMLEIADGAEGTNGESRAVRSKHWRVVIFQNLNARLRELDIRDDCGAEAMFAMIETRFSPELIERAGDYLYDVTPGTDQAWTYAEWRDEAVGDLRIIDGD